MPVSTVLMALAVFSAAAGILLWRVSRRLEAGQARIFPRQSESWGSPIRSAWHHGLQRFYVIAARMPLLKGRARAIRQCLSPFYSYDEWLLRRKTAAVLLGSAATAVLAAIVFLSVDQDALSWLMLLLVLSVAEGLYRDATVQRAERKLLKLGAGAFASVRQAYHRHRMVDGAIAEAAESGHPMVEPHMKRVLEMMEEQEPEAALAAYEEAAPNRYFKLFAGLSRFVVEYGDPPQRQGSSYLQGLSMLVREMQLELTMRSRLEYLLSGLQAIAVVPVLFADPIARWAKAYFPLMQQFYESKLGWVLQLAVFLTVLICHKLLLQLHWRADRTEPEARRTWERRLWTRPAVKRLAGRLMARTPPAAIRRIQRLLRKANDDMPADQFYARRWALAALTLCCGVCLLFLLQSTAASGAWNQLHRQMAALGLEMPPVPGSSAAGQPSRGALEAWKRQFLAPSSLGSERKSKQADSFFSDYADRLQGSRIQWWEVLLVLAASLAAYACPVLFLHIRIRLQHIDMRTEICQFQSLILLLRAFDRMTAEQIVAWMGRSSIYFRKPLHACLMNWESGAEEALRQLKRDAPYPDFVRFVEKIELAFDLIPLHQAFDDVEQDWLYEQEMIKQHYEKSIDAKAVWGQWFGFAPMYALVFLYLVIPLVWMSAEQMRSSFEQIRQL
ncbi:GTPase SAR1 [Paenibacillus dendritiformis]|uniref:GTPase SAR1 n=1 Tax=Paenibacillus dendritiformis TaxID=130049 RepID=UPI00143D2E5F|nr:GTPase SAR1 [Paenibacillus dendritiformis]NKI22985.1 GTPase SAR1 [Paenibacillus dendritiformis]NRF97711.1 GTPase SAR1 [Paenibacillus dendritiformis]